MTGKLDPFPGETCQYLVMAEGSTRVTWRLDRVRMRSTSNMGGICMKVVGFYERRRLPIFPRGFWERGVTGDRPGVKTWTYTPPDWP